jgi:hypothetical protein
VPPHLLEQAGGVAPEPRPGRARDGIAVVVLLVVLDRSPPTAGGTKMPLTDRPEFLAWLEIHNDRRVGRPHGDVASCLTCGSQFDHDLSTQECLVCLAERFGIETAEQWIADILAGFIRAAADPAVLAQVMAEIVPFARDVIEHRTTFSATG